MARSTVHHFWRSPALPFVESRCANDSSACYVAHSHPTLSLGAVDGGRSVFSRGGHQQQLLRGDVVLIPAGEVHCCNPDSDGRWSYQMLYLDEDWVRGVLGELNESNGCSGSGASAVALPTRLPHELAPSQVHARLTALNRCLFGSASLEDKETALLVFVGDLFGASIAYDAEAGSGNERLRGVQAMIATRCSESLTLDEMAAQAAMSRYHFVRAFRRVVGMTPHAWQLDRRIERARGLLDRGMALAEVALQLGFADQSHFQRAFKQRVAATPGEYLRNLVQD